MSKVTSVIAPVPAKRPINISVWAHKKKPNAYKLKDLFNPDPDIDADFEESLNQPYI